MGALSILERSARMSVNENSLGMVLLRAWLWLVPVGMFIAAIAFGVYAALEGNWALFGFMMVIGFVAVMLLIFHWWILYRFGKESTA
jgi:hypothetical protein